MRITYEKEINDTLTLAAMIKEDKWVDKDTIIVCCSPTYSSMTCQILNHSLSRADLLEQVYMEQPEEQTSQVWDKEMRMYIPYSNYVQQFVSSLDKNYNYLFIESPLLEGKIYSMMSKLLSARNIECRTACLYGNSIFKPDYYVDMIDNVKFEWQ